MDIKVSIIVPSLNVNDYISRCLDSLCNQTLEEIEIICIDAGSTDGTREKIIKYEKKDNRIKLIDSSIKSYGYQVNMGIKLAKGEYVSIVESDDYVAENMLLHLYIQAKKFKVDVSKGDKVFVYDDSRKEEKHIFTGGDVINYNREIVNGELMNLYINDKTLWNGIYRRKFLIDKKILLNESRGAAFQDIGFQQQIHMLADNIVFSDIPVYYYQMYRDGASTKSPNRVRYVFQEIKFLEDIVSFRYPEKWKLHSKAIHANLARCFADELRSYLVDNKFCCQEVDWYNDYLQIKEKISEWWENREIDRTILSESEKDEIYYSIVGLKEMSKYIKNTILNNKEAEEKIVKAIAGRECIVFGCGQWGRYILKRLDKHNKKIVAITDNNKKLWHSKIEKIEVLSPGETVKKWPEGMYIIANKKHSEEIEKQLMIMGVMTKNIIRYNVKWIDEC